MSLVRQPPSTAPQKWCLGSSGYSHGFYIAPGGLNWALTLARASDSAAAEPHATQKAESERRFWGGHLCPAGNKVKLQKGGCPAGCCFLLPSLAASQNLPGCDTLVCAKLTPQLFGEQAAPMASGPHEPSPAHIALGGFTSWSTEGFLDPFLGNPWASAKLKIPKLCPLPFSAARHREREGSKQLLLPNMGLTASDEATAEACRHPAGRFKGLGSSRGCRQDLAWDGQRMGQGFPCPVRCCSQGTVVTHTLPNGGQSCPTAQTPDPHIPSQCLILGGNDQLPVPG